MIITQTKAIEETITDLISITEESKKDATETQDNFNNVINFRQANNQHQNNESKEIGDTLLEVLTSIYCEKSSTETVIVPETQDNDRINSFLVKSPSQ